MKLCLLLIINVRAVFSNTLLSNFADRVAGTVALPIRIVDNIFTRTHNYLPRVVPLKPLFPINGPGFANTQIAINNDCSDYKKDLDMFERKLYMISFESLAQNNSSKRTENGVSFVQSGLFVYLFLMTFSTATNSLDDFGIFTQFNCDVKNKLKIVEDIINYLPVPNGNSLKLRWTAYLVLAPHLKTKESYFKNALHFNIVTLNTTNDLVNVLNKMIEEDSRGAFRDTFEESDFKEAIQVLFASTIYFRNNWRVSPTLLNDTIPFYDSVPRNGVNHQMVRAMRINDIVGYAYIHEWDAEAVEIQYDTDGMTLLAIIPRGTSLNNVAKQVSAFGTSFVEDRLQPKRLEITLPIYTLRMTLLLPEKMKRIGLSKLFTDKTSDPNDIKLSHAVQGIMFWFEAGKNAYKDDGITWDTNPDFQLVVDRPYVFFVKWNGITILCGNFVL